MNLYNYTTDELMEAFPKNIKLYKDGTDWVATDNNDGLIDAQEDGQSFRDFLIDLCEFLIEDAGLMQKNDLERVASN